MKFPTLMTAGFMALASCSPAIAFSGATGKFTVQGTVTDVQPHYSVQTIKTPHRKCEVKDVPIYGQGNRDVIGDVIIGAIIGGAIGNNAVKGDGAGAAGAVLGGLIGNEKGKQKNREIIGYRQQEVCNTHYHTEQVEQRTGSTVTVEYAEGALRFRTDRNYNVGDKINMYMDLTVR